MPGIVKDLAAMAFIAAAACFSFLPNGYFLELDDYFILAERAYFSNNSDWLGHLLAFNQSRFTWVGDYMLFRPGLFIVNWLFDVGARHNRELLHAVALINYAVAGVVLYLACSRYVTRPVALVLSGFFVVPRYSDSLANYPHINPYLFSMILLLAAALLMTQNNRFQKGNSAAGLLTLMLLAAALFHEFTVLALAAAGVMLLLMYRTRRLPSDECSREAIRCRAVPVAASLLLFLVLFIVNLIKSKVPCFYSPGEGLSSAALGTYLFRYALLLYKSVNFALPDAIFKMADIYNGVVWFPVMALFMVVAYRTKSLLIVFRKDRTIDMVAVMSLSAVAALAFGIVIGRFITRGSAMAWYIVMIGYFLLVIIAIVWNRVSEKIPGTAVRISQTLFVILAIVTLAHRSVVYHNGHREMNRTIQPAVSTSHGIIDFLDRHRMYSYAGIFPDPARKRAFDKPDITNLYRSINLVCHYYSSAVRAGIPVYARINDGSGGAPANASVNLYRMNDQETQQETRHTPLNLLPRNHVAGIDSIAQPRSCNRYEAQKKLSLAGSFTPAYLSDRQCRFRELRVRLKSDDGFPIMYNTGIFFLSDTNATLIALMDNEAVIYSGLGRERHIVSQGTLPRLSRLFDIVLRRNGPDCLVFMDEYLIAVIPRWDGSPGRIGIGTWENGTSPETAVEAGILPLINSDATELPLRLVEKIRLGNHL